MSVLKVHLRPQKQINFSLFRIAKMRFITFEQLFYIKLNAYNLKKDA
jgi:hypothetical protein